MPDKISEAGLEAARNFFQPTSISQPIEAVSRETLKAAQEHPQPVNQLGAKEEENLDINTLLRTLTGRALTSGLERFSSDLQAFGKVKRKMNEVDKIEDEWAKRAPLPGEYDKWEKATRGIMESSEFVELKEKLPEDYNKMVEQQIGVVDDIFRISIDQKKNAYPYDHRTAELTIRTAVETAQALQQEEWAQDPEAKVWLRRMEQDASWMADLLQVTVAESAVAPHYHDVLLQIQNMKERYKATITSDNLMGLNAKKMPGFGFDSTQEKLIKDKGIGLTVPETYKRYKNKQGVEVVVDLVKGGETLGLRELGVKMRDESFSTRMKAAAVSQADFSLKSEDEIAKSTFMGDHLRPEEFVFYRDLLGGADVKKPKEWRILAPHMVSEAGERKEVLSILEAVLVTNASERLESIIRGNLGSHTDKASAISGLVKEVRAEYLTRLSEWKTRGKDIVSQLAILTTRQGLYEDYAQLHVYRYCWQFIWDTDPSGKLTELKKNKVDTAGPFSYSGDAYSLYYMRRAAYYDRIGNSRTQFLLPTSPGGREELRLMDYDKMPHFDPAEVCKNGDNTPGKVDTFLWAQWSLLFSDDPAWVKVRNELGYGDIQEDIAKKLKDWAVKWRTPYSSGYADYDGTGYELVVPHFFPPGLDMANFYEAVTTGNAPHEEAKTVWQELIEGSTLSKINWDTLGYWPVDRWYVDLDMASNYMKVLIEAFDKEEDSFYRFVTGTPGGTIGPKKLANKIRLSLRDSFKGMPEEYEIALIPFFVTMACMDKHGIMGPSGWQALEKIDQETDTVGAERFLREMASWKRALKWLPSDRPGNKLLYKKDVNGKFILDKAGKKIPNGWKYGNTMALIAEFYESVLLRVGKSSAEESFAQAKSNLDKTVARVNTMEFLGKGDLRRTINAKMVPS